MYCEHTVGVVIPAYNEVGFIGDVINDIPDFVDRIFVIEDCSSDGTWQEILSQANNMSNTENNKCISIKNVKEQTYSDRIEQYKRIGLVDAIKHDENLGLGGALKTGYLAALKHGADIVAKVDGDGQMDLDYLPKLLDPIVENKADYSKANRLMYEDYRQEMPKFRLLGNSILTFLTKVASGYWKMMDPQNGYTAISNQALENVGIEDMYEYYGYCNDLLVKLNARGMRIADVAIPAIYGDEESSIEYTTYIRKVSWMLLKNFFWRLKTKYLVLDFHPLALFYLFGVILTALGIAGGGWTIYSSAVFNDSLFLRGTVSLLVFSLGCLFLMFAMLFDMQTNEEKEVQLY